MTMSLSVEEKMQYCSGNTYSLFSFGEPIGQYQPIVANHNQNTWFFPRVVGSWMHTPDQSLRLWCHFKSDMTNS